MRMTYKSALSRKATLASACLAASLTIASPQLLASSGGSSFGSSSSRSVDKQYELGRSYYKSGKTDYCVRSGDDVKKLSRRSAKQFKNGSVSDFVNSLYSCADPNLKIADLVPEDQGDAILHYLNKRYKLRLKG